MSVEEERRKEIEQLNNESEGILELDQLITEGIDAKIPFTFTFPNSDKEVGVLVRPLTASEFQKVLSISKKTGKSLLLEIVKLGAYKLNEENFSEGILEKTPAGIITVIANEISRISGSDLMKESIQTETPNIDDLLGF